MVSSVKFSFIFRVIHIVNKNFEFKDSYADKNSMDFWYKWMLQLFCISAIQGTNYSRTDEECLFV
jgi:hypothetical protein